MPRKYTALISAVVAASLFAAGDAASQPAEKPAPTAPPPNSLGEGWTLQQDRVAELVREHRLLPLARVIESVRALHPGRLLDAGLEDPDGRPIYRVRWMTNDGRRIDYLIDGATGAILSGH